MNFEPDADERAVQEGIRDLCRGRFPIERIRRSADGRIDRELWRELGDAGVFSLRLPEDAGGASLGLSASVLVFEELGRALVPGPLVATALAAGASQEAAAGTRLVGVIERADPAVVEHLEDLDELVVIDDDGLWTLDAGQLGSRRLDPPLDPLTPVHLVERLRDGTRSGDATAVGRWRLEGAALTAALLVGIAGAATDHAVEYAKGRRQFGRVIGSFQAVKHLLADMLVRTEVARSALYAAAAMLDDPSTGDVDAAVSGAKLLAGSAAFANGKGCVQVMGGMGFTWEMPAHLYLKRAVALGVGFGSAEHHEERLAATL